MDVSNMLSAWRRGAAVSLVLALTAAAGVAVTPGVASAAGYISFSAGVFEPGQGKNVWWNNANSDAYAPTLETTAVDDPEKLCEASIDRIWYEREASGEREFHLQITGDSLRRCQVTVWLAPLAMYRTTSLGDLSPGQSVAKTWNNAHLDTSIYVVGVLASQPASGTCAMEVTTEYRTQPDGENEFVYRTRNVGSVTCSAQLRHVELGVGNSLHYLPVGPNGGYSGWRLNPSTGTKVYVVGAAPDASSSGVCRWSGRPLRYDIPEVIYTDYVNTGTVRCGLTATFVAL